jgi:hypothetical protein
MGAIKCPKCGKENEENAKICLYCGEPLIDVLKKTIALEDTDYEEGVPKWGTARFTRMNLLLSVQDAEKTFTFDADEIDELVIGRRDPDTGEAPPVDLTDVGGLDKGVSRKHASIIRNDRSLHLVDKGSPNGTFLNGQKLVANQPRVLRDGDDIRLGHLVVRVKFERVTGTRPIP